MASLITILPELATALDLDTAAAFTAALKSRAGKGAGKLQTPEVIPVKADTPTADVTSSAPPIIGQDDKFNPEASHNGKKIVDYIYSDPETRACIEDALRGTVDAENPKSIETNIGS